MNKGRKKATGRFTTRAELEQYVWYLYHNTSCNQVEISRNVGVSPATVANILAGK